MKLCLVDLIQGEMVTLAVSLKFAQLLCKKTILKCVFNCPSTVQLHNFSSDIKNSSKVRVRFAPSPTGFLHLGGLRTALYNYLFAKQNNGNFILRIEDTDQQRLVPNAMEQLEDDLNWAGIPPDESPRVGGKYGPYQQSYRLGLYKKEVQTLLDNGSAYYCFCSEDRLNLLRREAMRARQVPKYDNRCRDLSKEEIDKKLSSNEKYCIRFKLTEFREKVRDIILGSFEHDISSIEGDPVIMKNDGFPTYHFANVVDDHHMEITHVLRGVEWHLSTTKHILLYRAFGWQPPFYAHLPLLLNKDGSKISKRQNDLAVESLRSRGIYPLALINLVSYSGGGFKDPPQNLNIQSVEQLASSFDINLIRSNSCQLLIDRLSEFNHAELLRRVEDKNEFNLLKDQIRTKIQQKFSGNTNLETSDEYISTVLSWSLPRIRSIDDLFEPHLAFLWVKPDFNHLETSDIEKYELQSLLLSLNRLPSFDKETLKNTLRAFSKEKGLKFNSFMMILRNILSGLKEGPSIAEMMELLGKKITIARLNEALKSS